MSIFRPIFFGFLFCTLLIFAQDTEDKFEDVEKQKFEFTKPPILNDPFIQLCFEPNSDSSNSLVKSEARKSDADDSIAKYDGTWSVEVPTTSVIKDDYALVLKNAAKHHAISIPLSKNIFFNSDELVIQYEVKFQNKLDCGGAYIKLLTKSSDLNLKEFTDKTPYTIMFGPDKCGTDAKYHFIIRYKNPKTGLFEEKHAAKITSSFDHVFSDTKTHLFTLVLRNDNTFERYIDNVKVQSGNLLTDFEPPFNPPAEIDDPSDKKPEHWDDREKIIDPTATKPDDWDENEPELIEDKFAVKPEGWLDDELEMVPDPEATPPTDWDVEMDGEWEAPKIKNPKCVDAPGCGKWTPPLIKNEKYKGKWSSPLINNPNYSGVWKAKRIPNPDYFEDNNPYANLAPIEALGLELWSMSGEIAFDNFIITNSKQEADLVAEGTWKLKQNAEKLADPKAQSVVDAVRNVYNEKPWLFFLVVFMCVLPIIFLCIYMCRSPSRSPDYTHKKTDESTVDDQVSESRPTEDGDAGDMSSEDDMVQVSSDESNTAKTVNDSGESAEEQVSSTNEEPQETRSVTRKRKSRKD